jgi:hypothetical protein
MLAAMAAGGSDIDRILERVVKAVESEQCILFLGAGVHAPPPQGSRFAYPGELRPPFGAALSRQLAADCGFAERFPREDAANLQRVALAYEIDSSRSDLVDAITQEVVPGKAPSPMLRALARLDFPLVITTNYDQLFEQALRDAGKQPRVAVYQPGRVRTTIYADPATPASPVIYKLHGDIGERGSLVVTDEDYIQFVLRMSDKKPYDPIPLSLKDALTSYKTLFVGYSLLDYNLRLLLKTLRWTIDPANVPAMYSVDASPDPLILRVWQDQRRYVTFLSEDVWSFVPRLYELVRGEELTA